MADQKKGNIFDQAINLMSNRDEKAAMEAAKQQMAQMEQQVLGLEQRAISGEKRATVAEARVKELEAALAKAQAGGQSSQTAQQAALDKVQGELNTARTTIAQLQQRLTAAEAKARQFDAAQAQAQSQAQAQAAQLAATLATHTLAADESLSHLALKYYGHATEPYWRLIYEANKAAIGDNPNRVRPGTELTIPVLPPNMKK